MIEKNQIEKISQNFRIDKFTVFREYLQVLFLSYLFKEKESEKIYFKGGTCLHLFFGSPRFSEDLDFSTELPERKIKKLIRKVGKSLKLEVPQTKISFVYKGKKSLRYRLKYQSKDFKYPQSIRIDFSFEKALLELNLAQLKTKFPIAPLPLILCLKEEEVLAEKIRALCWRSKGRDIFDLWFLLDKGVSFNRKIIEKKLKTINLKFDKKKLLEKIKRFPQKKIYLDVAKFLPENWRKIAPQLKEKLVPFLKNSF